MTITLDDLPGLLETMPPVGGDWAVRREHFGQTGQLFGWIAGPDMEFLVNWLPEAAKNYPRRMRIVEVGTFGGSTARGLIAMTGGGTIKCIDNFHDMNPDTLGGHPNGRAFWENTIAKNGTDFSSLATLLEGDSASIGLTWQDEIDLLLVDGDHHEGPAFTDMNLFGAHVVSGGYCLVDDYDMPEVARACHRYFIEGHLQDWRPIRRPDNGTAKIIVYQRV